MDMNLSELTEVLDESEFFERERTVCYFVELAILLYNHIVSLRKVSRVLEWIGLKRSDSLGGDAAKSKPDESGNHSTSNPRDRLPEQVERIDRYVLTQRSRRHESRIEHHRYRPRLSGPPTRVHRRSLRRSQAQIRSPPHGC